ncbi:methionyl-tRNA formyltransferase [Pseudoclavibacter endophyticus]|uniref:Methionyl-tRNA formyltransferase n=1 Tax=Pseudoclavibacter endophyticus TaxID=1778590 RepID=A0A6H9WT31_9MICO|nr:methionyl-tRNA formyltransferase [Pseudoclavibacter endophyticus]KAB1650097.1 methionyl-tRNA formyltransferase [Pseudoclavibacter endophyticus]GGA57238.1 methionyl-tRNA formyltransferase [Pseudoclavibacter endophyticus]
MRLVFAGTPDVAVPTLDALHAADHEIAAVVTRPDAPVGRKRVLTPSRVARRADELGLDVLRAARLGDDETRAIAALKPELGVVVAYGGLIRPPLLAVPAHGWINLHFSLLPAWRGAAPVQRAVLSGARSTGVSVFRLEAGLDTGPTFVRRRVAIGPDETAGELLERLGVEGAQDVLDAIEAIEAGAEPVAQAGEPTYAPKLRADDGRIDWAQSTADVSARIRGATPEPGATTTFRGAPYKVLRARVGATAPDGEPGRIRLEDGRVLVDTHDGTIELVTVQPPGKRGMPALDWVRGARDADGAVFE